MSDEPQRQPSRSSLLWQIPPLARQALPEAMIRIVLEHDPQEDKPLYDPRVRIAATQALIAMNRQNLAAAAEDEDDGQQHQSAEQRTRLAALARRLGVGELVDDDAADDEQCGVEEADQA